MEYRYLGRTGLQLSALSFGSWVTFHKQINDQAADELMSLAYENGVNFFDNAEVYALGESEKMMGRILKKKSWDRTSYVVSSKVFFGWRGKNNLPNQTGLSRKHITEACQEALLRLQVDYLDLYFCHRPDPQVPIAEVVWSMHHLIQQGKILYWGTSQWNAADIMEAHRVAAAYHLIGPVVEQPQYNLLERFKMEYDYLPVFRHVGLGTTIWSPLASGFLTGKYLTGIPSDSRLGMTGFEWLRERWLKPGNVSVLQQLMDLSKELGVQMSTLAIAWTLKNPHVTTTILGATRTEQLRENLQALDVVPLLTSEVMNRIEAIVQNKPLIE